MNGPSAVGDDTAALLDARARREALDPHRSMLLQAPAGSGKTTVLTARFLSLLATVEAPEEILAITFTRKAAAEMRLRIVAALRAPAGAVPSGIDPASVQAARARDRARGWDLERNPARLRIETIDALNHWLAGRLPVAAGAGAVLDIATDPAPIYRSAARRCLTQAQSDALLTEASELLFGRLDNDWERLERLLSEMLQRRSHWLPRVLQARDGGLVERVEQSLQAALHAELARAAAILPAPLRVEGEQLLAASLRARGLEHRGVVLGGELSNAAHWCAAADLALTGKDTFRLQVTVREGFPSDDRPTKERAMQWIRDLGAQPGARELLVGMRELPDAALVADDRAALDALALLLVRAAAELQLVFASAERVDFSYVGAAARAALSEEGEPSDFGLRLGSTLQHLLVDEFQDTSIEQFELLRALTRGWQRGDGRTLFVVGDPMQSIYQFREAEVGLFLRARDRGVGEIGFEALELRRNFRSREPIVEWINARFARLFPPSDDVRLAAIRYLPSVAAPPESSAAVTAANDARTALAAGVTLHRFDSPRSVAEAATVVRIIQEARASAPTASIGVLVASREHAQAIVEQLRVAGFPVRGVRLLPLRERPVVRDLSALTRALLHGADRSAWLALLRAPWCGLTLAELESGLSEPDGDLFARLDTLPETAMNAGARARVRRFCEALEPAIGGTERGAPLWQRVEHCWLRLGGPAIYRAQTDQLDARQFLDALARSPDTTALVGEAIEELTKDLFASAPPQAGAIDVMTIHAAKGLEWDVVILPGLGRSTRGETDPLLHWIELPRASEGSDLLLAPIRSTPQEPERSLGGYIKRLRRERSRLERIRLLYVAATRARIALHLCGALSASIAAGRERKPAPRSLLDALWPAIGAEFLALPVTPDPGPEPSVAQSRGVALLWRLPGAWTLPELPDAPVPQRLPYAIAPPSEVPEYRWVGLTARAIGTIVHAELHRLAARSPPGATAPEEREFGTWLAELAVPAEERPSAQRRIREALDRTIADPRGRWLLSDAQREAVSEWRVTGLYEGRLVSVAFDRMLVDESGTRWIVDYKTSAHEGGALEEFLAREVERYRPQLRRYVALAAQLGPEPVRAALYFPLLGEFREVPREALAASAQSTDS